MVVEEGPEEGQEEVQVVILEEMIQIPMTQIQEQLIVKEEEIRLEEDGVIVVGWKTIITRFAKNVPRMLKPKPRLKNKKVMVEEEDKAKEKDQVGRVDQADQAGQADQGDQADQEVRADQEVKEKKEEINKLLPQQHHLLINAKNVPLKMKPKPRLKNNKVKVEEEEVKVGGVVDKAKAKDKVGEGDKEKEKDKVGENREVILPQQQQHLFIKIDK